ncbi:uncharacterized protein CELE_F30A10.15 [Caenorhabditis elegans]|uniref:Uncharacterized protein n=1 Tax=Caenorhabditis elegans TaxID=6239 RepID=E1B6U8_CAEEL|nr:Uncharacterized protein CELE_F30A10.15 [Caenorhabditis elegans]CBW48378.1 Uncharacterized protein CELE_F30A10.15 [Caenorhabditis elegans]|eukprot:NP_001251103.1 Uncharacterized protein CELE_F30A10.15 [Caenorhabditis elegans]
MSPTHLLLAFFYKFSSLITNLIILFIAFFIFLYFLIFDGENQKIEVNRRRILCNVNGYQYIGSNPITINGTIQYLKINFIEFSIQLSTWSSNVQLNNWRDFMNLKYVKPRDNSTDESKTKMTISPVNSPKKKPMYSMLHSLQENLLINRTFQNYNLSYN